MSHDIAHAERERVLREFESLADFWTLQKGWIGHVALHDFRALIASLRDGEVDRRG